MTVGLVAAVTVLLLEGAGTAFAGTTLQQCMDQSIEHNGEPPTCTKVNGSWVPSWPLDPGPGGGGGVPGALVFFAALAVLLAVALIVWKVGTARSLATQAGMDPGLATQMTLLTEDGLDATYLAANVRNLQPGVSEAPPVRPQDAQPTAAERLTELSSLMDQGMVTASEYEERRRAVIDSV
jgi:hypothetical protein